MPQSESDVTKFEEMADQVFRSARSFNAWTAMPVATETLYSLYELMKMGPTSGNGSPARIIFIRSASAKEKLSKMAFDRNQPKILAAPVTAIIGHDLRFFEALPKLFPHNSGMADMFANNAPLAETTAFRNGSLQGAYLIIAARMLGLDCGPMSGFDNAAVDEGFFPGTKIRSNFICSLGYGDSAGQWDRLPRLAFEEACSIA
jgi:3-hydroxypropanoate dehydrogenase